MAEPKASPSKKLAPSTAKDNVKEDSIELFTVGPNGFLAEKKLLCKK